MDYNMKNLESYIQENDLLNNQKNPTLTIFIKK